MIAKIKNPQKFLPVINSCDVIPNREGDKLRDDVITRVVTFKPNPEKKVTEVCRCFEPMKVDFHQDDGSMVGNIISDGPSGKPEDIHLTFTFQWLNQDVEKGKEDEARDRFKAGAKKAVDGSIEAMRKMANDGEI